MNTPPRVLRRCPDCDAEMHHPKMLFCAPCWQRVPVDLRQAFNLAINIEARREAYRAILSHIKHERENPPLFALPAR